MQYGCSTKKMLTWLSDIGLKKFSLGKFTKKSFSVSSWTYSTELRAGEEVYPTQKGQIDKRFFDLVVLRNKCSGGCQTSSSKNSL